MDRNLTILIVDDNPTDIELLRRALTKAGINNPVRVVQSGQEAVEYLAGTGGFSNRAEYPFPSVLFTDLKMPGMDGFDVLRWLRSHPECSLLPVIVLTNSRLDADVRLAYRLGANSYMVKPTMFDELVQMIRAAYEYWAWCAKPESCCPIYSVE